MPEQELSLLIRLKDEATKQLKGFEGSLGKFSGVLKGMGIGIAAIGTAAIGAGAVSVKKFADAGDELQKLAQKTGFSTEALSELKYAADLSGTTIQTLQTGIRGMSSILLDAERGLSTATDTLSALGFSVTDFQGLSPEQAFDQMSQAVAGIEDPLRRAALAQDVFGRAGMELLPMFADGTEGLAAMRQEARELGIVFDQEAADKAAAFNDALTKLQGAFSGIMMQIGSALIPALMPLVDAFTDLVKALPLKEFGELIGTLLPPLVRLLTDFMRAIPLDLIISFVASALKPLVGILVELMGALAPIIATFIRLITKIPLEPFLDLLNLALKPLIPILNLVNTILTAMEPILDVIFGVLGAILKILAPVIEGIGKVIEWVAGGIASMIRGGRIATPEELRAMGLDPRFIPGQRLTGYAEGGIITSPRLAMVGEAGPEAIIPLSQGLSSLGSATRPVTTNNVYVTVQGSIHTEQDFMELIRQELIRLQLRNATTGII